MASNTPDSTPPRGGGLKSMLARLRGMGEARKAETAPVEPASPVAATVEPPMEVPPPAIPDALPVAAEEPVPVAEAIPAIPVAEAFVLPEAEAETAIREVSATQPSTDEELASMPETLQLCPHCHAPREGKQSYCADCGWIFPPGSSPHVSAPVQAVAATNSASRIKGRYELLELLGDRAEVSRYRGLDHGQGTASPVPVIILRAKAVKPAEPTAAQMAVRVEEESEEVEVMPSFDFPGTPNLPATEILRHKPVWPSPGWELEVLERGQHPSLPSVVDMFEEEGWEFLVEDVQAGQSLWDAWDDPEATYESRFGLLIQVAEALDSLHRGGAVLECLPPEIVTVTPAGRAVINDLSDLLPYPLAPNTPVRGTLYTAPELLTASDQADARSDLYSFGAMLYALYLGRELSETDFERPGSPKPFIPRFPDVHPLLGRLITKTFCRSLDLRFPSDEAGREDATGFTELIRILEVGRRTLDNVRLEIAAWTTTGIVRTGNEDAFGLVHAIESRQDDLGEQALVLLADGMGGYEAGEVAAALTIQVLRKNLLQQKLFTLLAGNSLSPLEAPSKPEGPRGEAPKVEAPKPEAKPVSSDLETCKQLLVAALKDANKQVFQASRTGLGKRGMGCTAEAVFISGRNVVVGHVGDSRTYHLHQGRIVQLTRDQTLVNRLVELGQLKPEEAETHPRRSELQQAIGGRPEVEPAVYHGKLKPGDWVVVCSDGLSNHINATELQQMLMSEANSAEMAARRLVNFVNIRGATDNATVVVVRAT